MTIRLLSNPVGRLAVTDAPSDFVEPALAVRFTQTLKARASCLKADAGRLLLEAQF